jgi:hypothetical protein
VKAKAEALLTTADEDTLDKFRTCDISKEIQSLTLGNTYGFDGIPMNASGIFHLVHLTYLFSHCLRFCHLPAPWEEAKNSAETSVQNYPQT